MRVIVTVRSGYWQESIAPRIRHPKVVSVVVPPLNDAEFHLLAKRVGFAWQDVTADVRQQLRKPRMLLAAARIPPEQLKHRELSYPLLQLLDLQQRGSDYRQLRFEHFVSVLRELGKKARERATIIKPVELRDLLGDVLESEFEEGLRELCDAGVLIKKTGGFVVHQGASRIALALHLVQKLRDLGTADHASLMECVRSEVVDQQDDSTAHVVTSAITAILRERIGDSSLDLDHHDPVLAALLGDWLRRYNADSAPARQARWLVPELVWLVENTEYREVDDLLVCALGARVPSDLRAALVQRLERWMQFVAPESQNIPRVTHRECGDLGERMQWAQALVSLRLVDHAQARLRRRALDIAARAAVSPKDLSLLVPILSVAVQPDDGWDPLRRWVCSSNEDWWPQLAVVWDCVSLQVGANTSLGMGVGHLLRHVWPTQTCLDTIPGQAPADLNMQNKFVDLSRLSRLVEPGERPTDEEARRLREIAASDQAHLRQILDHAGALALWMPHQLQHHIDCWADLASQEYNSSNHLQSVSLREFAPLVSSIEAKRLRAAVVERTDLERPQASDLSMVSWWSLPPEKRAEEIFAHLHVIDLDRSVLQAAPLTQKSAAVVLGRTVRIVDGRTAARVLFWLYWTLTPDISVTIRKELQSALPLLRAKELSDAGQYWLLLLGLNCDVPGLANYLVPPRWRYERDKDNYIPIQSARSAALSATGGLAALEVQSRCHSNHWNLTSSEPARQELIAKRSLALVEDFLSDQYRFRAEHCSKSRLGEMIRHNPDVVDRALCCLDQWRSCRALELADAIEPEEHPLWIELVETATDGTLLSSLRVNDIDQRFRVAFNAPETERARTIWNGLLMHVEHDAELLELVVAACQGNGLRWLDAKSIVDPEATPHTQLRAGTLAAMVQNPSQRAAVESARQAHRGWIQKGFERAVVLYDADKAAQDWYRRFRSASDWYQAYGCWRMHLEHIDLRHRLWDTADTCRFPDYVLPDAERYERTLRTDVTKVCRRRSEELKKTRFGMPRS